MFTAHTENTAEVHTLQRRQRMELSVAQHQLSLKARGKESKIEKQPNTSNKEKHVDKNTIKVTLVSRYY